MQTLTLQLTYNKSVISPLESVIRALLIWREHYYSAGLDPIQVEAKWAFSSHWNWKRKIRLRFEANLSISIRNSANTDIFKKLCAKLANEFVVAAAYCTNIQLQFAVTARLICKMCARFSFANAHTRTHINEFWMICLYKNMCITNVFNISAQVCVCVYLCS